MSSPKRAKIKQPRNFKTGINGVTITPHGGKWVVNYTYHGSSNVFAKEHETEEMAHTFAKELKA